MLGFPLTGVSGFRDDLDEPLVELVVGQNSSICKLDDMEDFRERIIADEIHEFVGRVLNPCHASSDSPATPTVPGHGRPTVSRRLTTVQAVVDEDQEDI